LGSTRQKIAHQASWLLNEWFHEGRLRTIGDFQAVLAELLDPSLPAPRI
jgi:hypothetical protein